MIESKIDSLRLEKFKTIKTPKYIRDNDCMDHFLKHEYVYNNHREYYERVISVWRELGGITLRDGHSYKLNRLKNQLGTLIYI